MEQDPRMPLEPDFDTASAHRYFAAHCFNACWPLLDKPTRSTEEVAELVALGHASLWHWTKRSDCTPKNLSVAHWMLARIYSILRDAAPARQHAEACLRFAESAGVPPFYLGCAHESLARAAVARGDRTEAEARLSKAQSIADSVDDPENRKILLDDLASVRSALNAA
jgi:hypothetical protein